MHHDEFLPLDEPDDYFGTEVFLFPFLLEAEEDDLRNPTPADKKRIVTLAGLERQLARPGDASDSVDAGDADGSIKTLNDLKRKWDAEETPW